MNIHTYIHAAWIRVVSPCERISLDSLQGVMLLGVEGSSSHEHTSLLAYPNHSWLLSLWRGWLAGLWVARGLGWKWSEQDGRKGGTSEDVSGSEGEGEVSDGPVGLVASVQMWS